MRKVMTLLLMLAAQPALGLPATWPATGSAAGKPVTFPSSSPFSPAMIGRDAERTTAVGTWFAPASASNAEPAPAVVLLHGSGGVIDARERGYARQLAQLGVGALVIDSFAARRDKGIAYLERILNITETMAMADAFAGLSWLGEQPEIDAGRVALIGFSYGGMATLYAANAGIAERLAPDGRRFVGHVAYYAPCITDFAEPRTTGAPILMLMGGRDALIDEGRCRKVADELRGGGSEVAMQVFPEAYHQWDGARGRTLPRGLADCRFQVDDEGGVTDARSGLGMNGYAGRGLALSWCSDRDGFEIRRDDGVRARSTAILSRFLTEVFERSVPAPG